MTRLQKTSTRRAQSNRQANRIDLYPFEQARLRQVLSAEIFLL